MKQVKSTNASVFIPHLGCPNKCSFCDKNAVSERGKSVTAAQVGDILEAHAVSLKRRGATAQIAFFGGTFTALEEGYRASLLETANDYIKKYPRVFTGIRCSTRPDCVDAAVLRQLREYGVTAIELGAQSMDDGVLAANGRGHTADDVRESAGLVRRFGFELGLQMMTGLYADTLQKSLRTADELIKLKPRTARIYPVVIIRGTRLAEMGYKTFGFDETVGLCAEIYGRFVENGVRVIRVGLNYGGDKGDIVGGNYSPVMGELCAGRYYFNKMKDFMEKSGGAKFRIYADKRDFSKLIGHKGENKRRLLELGYTYKIKEKQGGEPEIRALPQRRDLV
ncbi:MAG: radical SAM protein [Oscillospiraceae bacterium]|jgi:histone acetyltransferase (RNA polymerase elongator complex component)|nr:radical SAM protein [Oscillospiraceae bacterium]